MVEVKQEDRDAAADLLDADGLDWGACGDVREGRQRHHYPAAFNEGLERAVLAVEAQLGSLELQLKRAKKVGDQAAVGRLSAARSWTKYCAQAIRALKESDTAS